MIGIDHSGKLIEAVTARLAEKGVLVDAVNEKPDGSHSIRAIGMANGRKGSVTVPKQEQELTPEELESQSAGFVEDIESQLRSGMGSWE